VILREKALWAIGFRGAGYGSLLRFWTAENEKGHHWQPFLCNSLFDFHEFHFVNNIHHQHCAHRYAV